MRRKIGIRNSGFCEYVYVKIRLFYMARVNVDAIRVSRILQKNLRMKIKRKKLLRFGSSPLRNEGREHETKSMHIFLQSFAFALSLRFMQYAQSKCFGAFFSISICVYEHVCVQIRRGITFSMPLIFPVECAVCLTNVCMPAKNSRRESKRIVVTRNCVCMCYNIVCNV